MWVCQKEIQTKALYKANYYVLDKGFLKFS